MSDACTHAQPYLPGYSICLNSSYYLCPRAFHFADMILCRHLDPQDAEDGKRQD